MEFQLFSHERQKNKKTTINITVFNFLYLTNPIPLTKSNNNYNGILDFGLFLIRPKISEMQQIPMNKHIIVHANIKLKCCIYTQNQLFLNDFVHV